MCVLKKGQAGIEYVILLGILLLFLIPTIYYSLNEANRSVKINQLENSVRRLVKAADAVHAVGPGTIEVVTITLPEGIIAATVNITEVYLQVSMFGGITDVHYSSHVNMTGELPNIEGTYSVKVESLRSGVVNITLRQ
ncbi:MAG: hypothetical protein AABW64_00260 [Nanoarchaeota archaeon]